MKYFLHLNVIVYFNIKSDNQGGNNGPQHNIYILQQSDEDTDLSNSFRVQVENNKGLDFIYLKSNISKRGNNT